MIQTIEVSSRNLAAGTVGYVSVAGFSDVAADEVVAALTQHVAAGQKKLILDLRGNPGGYVTAARKIASQFIGSGVVFWEQDAAGNQVATDALSGGVATDPAIRLVVLIDGGSASASEIVAGALQDTGRAMLIGAQSYGKGTVQQWQQLSGDGGAFRLTVARWLTPNKRWIHKVGLTPDVVVALPKSVADRQRSHPRQGARGPGADPTRPRARGCGRPPEVCRPVGRRGRRARRRVRRLARLMLDLRRWSTAFPLDANRWHTEGRRPAVRRRLTEGRSRGPRDGAGPTDGAPGRGSARLMPPIGIKIGRPSASGQNQASSPGNEAEPSRSCTHPAHQVRFEGTKGGDVQ